MQIKEKKINKGKTGINQNTGGKSSTFSAYELPLFLEDP